jgi:hypothetical protein
MEETIFYQILVFNIIDSDLQVNKVKELKLTEKIVDLYTKYKYYKYKCFLNHKNEVDIFIRSQKIYNLVRAFCNKLKYRCAKIYNNEDLLGNEIDNKLTFNTYIDKFIYKFTYEDLIKIIKNGLLNYDSENAGAMITNNFLTPLEIKNPYTNIPFKKHILYNFYMYSKNHKYKIPTYYQMYYELNFELKDLFLLHENYLTLNSIKNYTNSLDNETKYNYLLKSNIIFCDFLTKHFDKIVIRYLCAVFKNKFYNLDLSVLSDNYNEIIFNYLCLIYYYKCNNSKNFVGYKIKLVMGFLYHKKISFIDDDIVSYLTISDIVERINDKIEIIISREIDDYRIINNIDVILNYQRSNSYINNPEADVENEETNTEENEETNDEETNDEETNDEETNGEEIDNSKIKKKILLKERIKLNIFKLNDICENSKPYKIFCKLTIFNVFFINCYCNIFILRKAYSLLF